MLEECKSFPLVLSFLLLSAVFLHSTASPLPDNDVKLRDVNEFKPTVVVVPKPPTEVYRPYPLTKRFHSVTPYLIHGYKRSSHVAVSLLDTLEGSSEEHACAEVTDFVKNNLTRTQDQCIPTYKCSFDPARFPTTLISVTCTNSIPCIDSSYFGGTCLAKHGKVTVLKFIQSQETKAETGSGSGASLAPLQVQGEWVFQTLLLVNRCYCSDTK